MCRHHNLIICPYCIHPLGEQGVHFKEGMLNGPLRESRPLSPENILDISRWRDSDPNDGSLLVTMDGRCQGIGWRGWSFGRSLLQDLQ
ncbi:Hypothetical protein FKW44_002920 [Caligus rogercresseyi]|uniref:Uncharacterized protein n=1 Tax=Caligus rogercresseyi TaxID=217165 RepID=A0A7T8KKW4_CALRO|nr:Hypothetical protein FKW44_002920 [Caligus rogercresseyi]